MALSGRIQKIDLDKIVINRDERQRRTIDEIEQLAESIRTTGLMHPIVIDQNNVIIAGERRFSAVKYLRDSWVKTPEQKINPWTKISVQYYLTEQDPIHSKIIELEENIHRKNMPWQDTALAIYSIYEYLSTMENDDKISSTAKKINLSISSTSDYITLGKKLTENKDDETLSKCTSVASALEYISKKAKKNLSESITDVLITKGKKKSSLSVSETKVDLLDSDQALSEIIQNALPNSNPNPNPNSEQSSIKTEQKSSSSSSSSKNLSICPNPGQFLIVQDNFLTWSDRYRGEKFTFIHCDFPHESNFDQTKKDENYDLDIYWNLCDALIRNIDNLLGPTGTIMFWISMKQYSETVELFSEIKGLSVDPYPLILSSIKGLIPPNNGCNPRRNYDAALFMNRGRTRMLNTHGNHYHSFDLIKSEKSPKVLSQFFSMFIDNSTRVLDPTCGNGSAIIAARELKAKCALGIEINAENVKKAKINLANLANLANQTNSVNSQNGKE